MQPSELKPTEKKNLPGIFISYRRSDTPDAVGRIYDRLVSEFGKARVFKDVDSIPLGQDFRGHLNDIVGGCAAVLAVIGPKWTDIRNEAGSKRLEDPDDFVRIELEAALARSVPVVPVLVGHAPMPGTSQLPSSLASLAFRQSIEVRPDPDFHNDATRLVSALRAIIDPNAPQAQAPAGESTKSITPTNSNSRWLAWTVAAAAVLGMAAMLVPTLRYLRETPPTETRVDIVTPATDLPDHFALSPDGGKIVFVARGDGAPRLWLRSLTSAAAQPLSGTENAVGPFWSPDSRSIGFFVSGALKRLDLDGGQPQVITTEMKIGYAGSWNSDGIIVFSGVGQPLMRVDATGGSAAQAVKVGAEDLGGDMPVFLPGGRFLFLSTGEHNRGIYLGALDGRKPVLLAPATDRVAYLPSGWMLWLRARALVAQRLDIDKAILVGEVVTLADGVTSFSVATTGLVAYRAGKPHRRQLTWVDRSGKSLGTVGDPDESLNSPRIAPDGRRVAVVRDLQTGSNIWLLDGERASRVTFDSKYAGYPVWSPDGTRITFLSTRSAGGDLYQKLANGLGADEQLVTSEQIKYPSGWSTDGRYLLYFAVTTGKKIGSDIWVLPVTGDRTPYLLTNTPAVNVWGQISPDGRWVAYQSDATGQYEIFVRPFIPPNASGAKVDSSAGASQWQISTSGGVYPLWRPDGKELYFLDSVGELMAVQITVTGSALVPGSPIKLFDSHIWGGGTDSARGRQYDIARDGRFLINRELSDAAQPITLIQNWNPNAGK